MGQSVDFPIKSCKKVNDYEFDFSTIAKSQFHEGCRNSDCSVTTSRFQSSVMKLTFQPRIKVKFMRDAGISIAAGQHVNFQISPC